MDCPYYQSYKYCRKIHGEMSDKLFDDYCMSMYSYNECPIYNDENSSSGSGGCFLTTACVKCRGLSDDCYVLTRLRWFRDNVMAKTEKGKALIKLYYDIAPKIVEAIDKSDNYSEEYDVLYNTWIVPCVALIDAERYTEAELCYSQMVNALAQKYLSV